MVETLPKIDIPTMSTRSALKFRMI